MAYDENHSRQDRQDLAFDVIAYDRSLTHIHASECCADSNSVIFKIELGIWNDLMDLMLY
jgi:hypothetical protein